MYPTKFDVVLVDADRLVMASGFSSEKSVNGELIYLEPLAHALQKAKNQVIALRDKFDCTDFRLYITDNTTKHFRYKVAKTKKYKYNRKKQKRPEYEEQIREYLIKYHDALVVSGVEVDDAVSIEQVRNLNEGKTSIIISNDKDLDMVPGWHFDPDWGIQRVFNGNTYTMKSYKKTNVYCIVDPGFLSLRRREGTNKAKLVGGGQLWFCAQLLMGDKVDNVPGCPLNSRGAYGEVSTYEALKNCKTYEEGIKVVWNIYKEKLSEFLTEEQIRARLLEVGQLLWIKRGIREKIFPIEWVL